MSKRYRERASGFVLITVVVVLAILATLAMMATSTTDIDNAIDSQLADSATLNYAAESGVEHAMWMLNQNTGCSDYPDLSLTQFGEASYQASIMPKSGSPVTIESKGMLSNAATKLMQRSDLVVYDRSSIITRIIPITKDTFTEAGSGHTDHNKGTDSTLKVGSEPGNAYRTLFEFDLSALPDNIRIESATLQIELDKLKFADQVDAYRITRSWTEEEVTWESYDGSNNWDAPGGDYDSQLIGSFLIDSIGTKNLDLTAMVSLWTDGVYPNNGIVLITPETPSGDANDFVSSDDNSDFVPVLIVNYACECGSQCAEDEKLSRPIAHWHFDDGDGLIATDSAGINTGVLDNGALWQADGAIDGALFFDGLNDQVSVVHDDSLNVTSELTISAWINLMDDNSGATHRILSKESFGANDSYWLSIQASSVWFGVENQFFSDGSNLIDGRWYHIAAVFDDDANEVQIYIDGVEEFSGFTNTTITPNDAALYIGSNWQRTKMWHGYLDDVRLYRRALTEEDVNEVMSSAPTGSGAAVAANFRDQFDARDYDNDDGTLPWATDWIEFNEADGDRNGDEQVRSDGDNDFAIRVRDNDGGGEGVQREFNASTCSSLTLSFDYRREGFDNENDFVTVSASSDGGAGWTEIGQFAGPADDIYYQHFTYDLTPFIAADSRVRFLTSPQLGGADVLWIDNVQIACR